MQMLETSGFQGRGGSLRKSGCVSEKVTCAIKSVIK